MEKAQIGLLGGLPVEVEARARSEGALQSPQSPADHAPRRASSH